MAELIFHVLSTNVVAFGKASWESPARTNLFQKVKKEHFVKRFFFSLPSGTREYHLSPITYSYISYRRLLLLNNVKAPRVGLQQVIPATDASHTSITPPIYD